MGEMGKKQTDSYKRIPSIMKVRYNNAPVSFPTDNGVYVFHLFYYVHFAHGRRVIFTPLIPDILFINAIIALFNNDVELIREKKFCCNIHL